MTSDRRIDDAIDRAVRRMMQIDPAPGLSQRVLTRLDASVERRILTFPRLAAVAACAAAAAVLAIVLLLRPAPSDNTRTAALAPQPPPAQAVERTLTHPAPPLALPSGPEARASLTRVRPSGRGDRRAEGATVARYEGDIRIDPLAAIDPIRFRRVEPDAIELSDISINSIEVAPLRVDPLSSTPH